MTTYVVISYCGLLKCSHIYHNISGDITVASLFDYSLTSRDITVILR